MNEGKRSSRLKYMGLLGIKEHKDPKTIGYEGKGKHKSIIDLTTMYSHRFYSRTHLHTTFVFLKKNMKNLLSVSCVPALWMLLWLASTICVDVIPPHHMKQSLQSVVASFRQVPAMRMLLGFFVHLIMLVLYTVVVLEDDDGKLSNTEKILTFHVVVSTSCRCWCW